MDTIQIGEIFKNYIKIEPKVMGVETLFNNTRRFTKTNYKPPYQRNYVWNDDKASYFIESILLGTEIPPLIFFTSGEKIEVIDGRQRYETIYRYVNDHFKLKKSGLTKLEDLANKNFTDLKELKDVIWDTKLRIIEFSFHSKPDTEYDIEDLVKKEIFKRYNTGITPLKPTEIDKAKYIGDDLNSYIKLKLTKDRRLFEFILRLFHYENEGNIESVLKRIRQLLVQHKIPISYYATRKQEVLNKFYDLLSDSLNENEIDLVFKNLIRKLNYLQDVRAILEKKEGQPNRLIFECLYWALSVIENENISIKKYDNIQFKEKLSKFLITNIESYSTTRSSFASQIFERYSQTASFFEKELSVDFKDYVRNHDEFKKLNRTINSKEKTDADTLSKFESLRLNKPDASSVSIDDITNQMQRQRFLIRPLYQRNEVINKNKSSSIIESILLGIKLPPIFVYKRPDGISEVVDGQQRLLSILGFLGKEYLNENKELVKSEKDKFSLNLPNGILKDIHRKKYNTLPKGMEDKILDFDLWVIEIDHKNNPHFDPIDLFIRLNYKPYPIKENTFEMWNSYVDRNIIESVKAIYKKNQAWFYLRKNNARMENEGLIMFLIYLQYKYSASTGSYEDISGFLDFYKSGNKINVRIKSKTDITKILDSPDSSQFLQKCTDFENTFILKLKAILGLDDLVPEREINDRLEKLMNIESSKRTNQTFYLFWFIVSNLNLNNIENNILTITLDIQELFKMVKNVESKDRFENAIKGFWEKYR